MKNAESGTFRFPPDVLAVLGAGQKDRGLSECDKISLHYSAIFWGFPNCFRPTKRIFSAECTIGMVWGLTPLKHYGTMTLIP